MKEILVQGGLNQAEVMQNSLDIFGSQDTCQAVRRFYGKYIDEVDVLKKQIIAFGEVEQQFHKDDAAYRKLLDEDSSNGIVSEYSAAGLRQTTKFGQAIMQAAGGFIGQARNTLFEHRDTYLDAGDSFSRMMADYIQNIGGGPTSLPINGTVYSINEGVITKKKQEADSKSDKWTYVIFGNLDTLADSNQKHYGSKGDGTARTIFPTLATPKDWLQLFDDLEKAQQF